MPARRPQNRIGLAGGQRFFDHRDLEHEILNDTRWPQLRLLPTGEIISLAQAARIYHLLASEHSIDSVIRHVREEWNREVSDVDIEVLIHFDLDHVEATGEPIPEGHHIIDQTPTIAERGYVNGLVICAGIRHELIDLRRYGAGVLRSYVHARWGLRLDLQTVTNVIQEWETATLVSINTIPHFIIPDNARPAHEGLTLADFTTGSRARPVEPDRAFFANPPPRYEPRPVFRGVSFPHPR